MPESLLRVLTCGSVDDGKSTLIGRLLFECGTIPDDVMMALERDSVRFGTVGGGVDTIDYTQAYFGITFGLKQTGVPQVVDPTDTAVIFPVPGDLRAKPTKRLLTMTTCNPEYSATQRLIVTAELTGTGA